jgi:hypothetical protein
MTDPSPTLAPNTPTEKRLLWVIRGLVIQSCTDVPKGSSLGYDDPTPVFSGFIGVHAEAIALLAEYGLVSDLSDNGGRVVSGNILPVGESAKVLKTGPFDETRVEAAPESPSEEALARYMDAFFRPSPVFERLRKAAE